MKHIDITEDESGTLVLGYFYALSTLLHRENKQWPMSAKHEFRQYIEIERETRTDIPLCSRNPKHRTYTIRSVEEVAYFSGDGDIVACIGGFHCLESFVDRLKEAKFTGWNVTPCRVIDSDVKNPPTIFSLAYDHIRPYRRNVFGGGFTNRCLKCDHGPVFCTECDQPESTFCPKCGDRWVEYGHPDDEWIQERKTPFYWVKPVPDEGYVIDASRWNGQDFFDGYVTGRVVRALLKWGSWPFVARPVRAFIDSCTCTQIKKLNGIRFDELE